MRVVRASQDLSAALAAARREARSAFGDETLLLERLVLEPRHIEFQIFGDLHGHLIHLGERECTIQRRHQKIVEETPSTALTPDLRARMAEAALTIGRQLGYTNAGTVEFVLDPDGHFYFLEVNTRLQVEHPITELVTGLDFVRWQIEVAEGRPLPLTQSAVACVGHAVEVRVYAEDPATGFLPASGRLELWREPTGKGIRVDTGVRSGDTVSIYYDPLLAKISAHGADRDEALRRLEYALGQTVLLGVRNNLEYLRAVLAHPAHRAGLLSTAFVERYASELLTPAATPTPAELPLAPLAAVLAALAETAAPSAMFGWRNNPGRPPLRRYVPCTGEAEAAQEAITVELRAGPGSACTVAVRQGAASWTVEALVRERDGMDLRVELDGHVIRAVIASAADGERWVWVHTRTVALRQIHDLPVPTPRQPFAGGVARADARDGGARPDAGEWTRCGGCPHARSGDRHARGTGPDSAWR